MATGIESLPQQTLHRILSLLSQQEAVQTSLVSKSWRHLWCGRSKFELCESEFTNKQTTFVSVVDNTLHGYLDQQLPLEELRLKISENESSARLLEKWIPVITLRSLGVQVLDLSTEEKTEMPFSLLSISESLRRLTLQGYNLNLITSSVPILFKNLKRLTLRRVHVADETFEKIMRSCPLIERVYLENCEGLKTIKIDNKHLNVFILTDHTKDDDDDDDCCCSIRDINAPNIEAIVISGRWEWFFRHNYFPHLKSLILQHVQLPSHSLDIFSSSFPCLEYLRLTGTHGYEQFQLSSPCIRSLAIQGLRKSIKVTINAPNILFFEYSSFFVPSSFSFAATCGGHDWISDIDVSLTSDISGSRQSRIAKLLKAVSQSQVSLDLHYDPSLNWDILELCQGVIVDHSTDGCDDIQRVEHLVLIQDRFLSEITDCFLSFLFRIVRPRYTSVAVDTVDLKITKSLYKRLVHGSSTMSWKRDLEQTCIEASEDNGEQWHQVPESALSTGQMIRFRLTWREIC